MHPLKTKIFPFILLGLLFSSPLGLSAQEAVKRLQAKYIEEPIQLDGRLDEPVWELADTATDFWQFFPTDSLQAQYQTKVKIVYDETTLYVGIRAESSGSDYVVSSLRRDFGGTTNDNVSLLFDTFNDGTNAFFFGVTPYGVQREGQVAEGGSNFNNTWDIKWYVESQMYDDHYVVEIAIPFTSLKFIEGATSWRFRAYRWNLQTNVQSTWVRVPQNNQLSSLAYMGELVFEKPLGRSRTPISLIPYVNALAEKDYVEDVSETKLKVGGDAKIAIGNGLNLDITLNPDFSNVEVDDIFTNLTRFELQLPEKRQFFIDNMDLFASFGNTFNEAKPFFSRRIGLATDPDGNLIENQILAGIRLSGKLNKDWRLGFLNIQTDEDVANEIASNNNMMFTLQRKVFSRSNIGIFFINRQSFKDYDFLDDSDQYNRVIGADYNLASPDDVWKGRLYLHKSFQPGDSEGNFSSQAMLEYNTRKYNFITDVTFVDKEFRSDLGYVPRNDIFKYGILLARNLYPAKGSFNRHQLSFLSITFWSPSRDFMNTDQFYRLQWQADFKDQSRVTFGMANNYIYLTDDFDPTGTEGAIPLPGNQGYTFNQATAEYQSNMSQLVTFNGSVTAGQFFNGENFSFGGQVSMRFQPWAQLSVAVNYDRIRLPEPYASADIWLLSPKAEITFSKSLFWSTIVQYSNQRENLGINSRLQWRFAPLSDLYLVYNDNYFTTEFSPKFRSINLKVTYWLNI